MTLALDCLSSKEVRRIAESNSYNEYIESFCETNDIRYLRNGKVFRQLFRNTEERASLSGALSQEQFWYLKDLKAKVILGTHYYFCEKTTSKDPVLEALLEREKPNQHKIIATIIFVLTHDRRGFEISGYIDYEASIHAFKMGALHARNWKDIFSRRIKLMPVTTDLSFAHWRSGKVYYNETDNFKPDTETLELKFIHKGDRNKISAFNVKASKYDQPVELRSDVHGYVMLLDHVIRRKT